MSSLECNICSGRLPDYVDGKLEENEFALMRDHLGRSEACAEEERRLRVLFSRILERTPAAESMPDAGSFLVGVNAGIDRASRGYRPLAKWTLRPSVLVPVLAAAMVIIVAGLFLFPTAERIDSGDTMFSGLIDEADLSNLSDISPSSSLFDEVMISDLSYNRDLLYDVSSIDDETNLNSEIDLTLLDDVSYSAVVSASLEYISTDEVLENLSDTEAERIVTALEQQPIRLL